MKITIKIVSKTAIKIMLKNYDCNKKMSFLKIRDPVKRDLIVKEYLELKKNIRDNLSSERIGEQQLQTDLSKFYRPITDMQKATTREITEELKPIKEGIEKLPQAIKFPPIIQRLREVLKEASEDLGDKAYDYLHTTSPYSRDETFGIYKGKDGYYRMVKQKNKENEKILTIASNNIYVDDEKFSGTDGLWHLIMEKNPSTSKYTSLDLDNYERLLIKANVLNQNFDPTDPYPRSSGSTKWKEILSPIWESYKKKKGYEEEYEGEGVIVIPSNPNALLERLDLLLSSQEAGHTGVGNELVSICDELKRQGVLDTKTYKRINSIIKKL